ncbi:SH3, type 3 domain protein [Luminiphilus syltensis NOR5-1B]|uniref:SH3, type 3 domain protein n=1 Tax=Luminiphilus syltensis NOR5-1B TaxID=565045 RepID=B8KQK3_9GAMM|nr:TIGR04211 family SH3 domain-containing protein [Luminiphilus syltensis]EED34144.1 SH3, type 3 domain protein [Luminiphilus syltensis NOR5-1B]
MRKTNALGELRTTIVGALLALMASGVLAQETQYVSDKVLVPVRSGAGSEYRIVHRGIPSGTALTVFSTTEDEVWSEIETRGGTRGWVRTQYLQEAPPAALLLADQRAELDRVRGERDRLREQLQDSKSAASEAGGEISTLSVQLEETQVELAELKRVSGAAVELDSQNRILTTELEEQRSEAELLHLENVRLQERVANNQLIDGALAVLLGVILAVVAPRLWPRRRSNDGWV